MNKFYSQPSFYSHLFSSFILFIAFILIFKNYSKIIHLEPYKLIMLLLVLSLCIGIHGLSHLGLEKEYGYNPASFILYGKNA